MLLFAAFSLGQILEQGGVLSSDNMSRLSMGTADNSTAHRLEDAEQTLNAFEEARSWARVLGPTNIGAESRRTICICA